MGEPRAEAGRKGLIPRNTGRGPRVREQGGSFLCKKQEGSIIRFNQREISHRIVRPSSSITHTQITYTDTIPRHTEVTGRFSRCPPSAR